MRVIPVIDLMHGQVVRGVAGQRERYRPIESVLAADAQPPTIGRALAQRGFRETYVADLDAIRGAPPTWAVYEQLMRLGLELWVDAGLASVARAGEMACFRAEGRPLAAIVAGLESLSDPRSLAQLVAAVGPRRLIFSLDLKGGAPIVGWPQARHPSAMQIATLALRGGARGLIVLDLARVGMGQGVGTEPICRQLRALDNSLEIIAGGGVRSAADLRTLAAAGCDAALVASALHDGRLDADDCARMGRHTGATTTWARASR